MINRPGIMEKLALNSVLSPMTPIIQGVTPNPAIPKQESNTNRIVVSTFRHLAASARIVGQKQAVAIPASTKSR